MGYTILRNSYVTSQVRVAVTKRLCHVTILQLHRLQHKEQERETEDISYTFTHKGKG